MGPSLFSMNRIQGLFDLCMRICLSLLLLPGVCLFLGLVLFSYIIDVMLAHASQSRASMVSRPLPHFAKDVAIIAELISSIFYPLQPKFSRICPECAPFVGGHFFNFCNPRKRVVAKTPFVKTYLPSLNS